MLLEQQTPSTPGITYNIQQTVEKQFAFQRSQSQELHIATANSLYKLEIP